ncbi:MAG: molybdopterin-guanine dinucleotide biosynthesis protein B [Pseudomonadales bacterium]
MIKVFGVTGWKNSGKTTLVVKLVEYFVSQGLRVGTIKRAHCGFDIDHPGTDSYMHREAGAQEVMIASERRWAKMHELKDEGEQPLSELLKQFGDLDLVIVEGYKADNHPKIQAVRPSISLKPMNNDKANNIVALAAEAPSESGISAADLNVDGPVLDLNDVEAIAAYIRDYLDL